MVTRLLKPIFLKRFMRSVQTEGWKAAINKSLYYGRLLMHEGGRSAVEQTHPAPTAPPQHYGESMWRLLAEKDAFHISAAPALLSKKRYIAIIGDLNLPQCRKYRVEQLAEFWRLRGVSVKFAHYEDAPRCSNIMQSATHLILYRLQSLPACTMFQYEARRLRLPVLYDIDDPLFSVSAYETYKNISELDPALKSHFIAQAPKYLDVMNAADILTMSTPGLVEHARLYSPRPVYLRRNFADETTLRLGTVARETAASQSEGDGLFRVGFVSGSHGHEIDFREIQDRLIEFVMDKPNRRLTIIGRFDTQKLPKRVQNRVEMHPFTDYATYMKLLATVDCVVMPLCDVVFNRCKSAVRVLDAASVGVPAIVSSVGDLHTLVKSGETGFVAARNQDFSDALNTLAADPKAAQVMGQKARQNIEDNWSGQDVPHIIDPEIMRWVTA